MGGILRKVTENDNEVTVAYMTSGNIAVFDHDVRRYVDFLERLAGEGLHRSRASVERARGEGARVARARRRPGEVDIPEVQDIKRIIREAEAVSGIETVGLPRSAARFLNLPFYQTGKVRKDPIGPADVAIVRELLEEMQPDLIFVAGDLSDPHGTHRMCKEAIDRALARSRRRTRSPKCGSIAARGRSGRFTKRRGSCRCRRKSCASRSRRSSSISRRRTRRPSPAATTSASSGSASKRATRGRRRSSTDSGLAEYFAMEAYVVDEHRQYLHRVVRSDGISTDARDLNALDFVVIVAYLVGITLLGV